MAKMNESTKIALVVVAIIAIAGAFWLLLLAPKREKASELSEQVSALSSEVASARQQVVAGLAAKNGFADDYRQLVELGKAVPAEAATPSLLVQLNGLSERARTSFQSIALGGAGGGGTTATATEATAGGTAGELLPLGAAAGPSGFAAMPYALAFEGGFFDITKFIDSLDSLVQPKGDGEVDAHGRLVTIDGFSLVPVGDAGSGSGGGSPSSGSGGALAADFTVTTYVTPPGQGLTAGATSAGPSSTTTDLP
jgi:Tfp pilus assembly protein PilO